MSHYLLRQAIVTEAPDPALLALGIRVAEGKLPFHVALDHLVEQEYEALHAELHEALDSLRPDTVREIQADLQDHPLIVEAASIRLSYAILRAEHPDFDDVRGVQYRPDTDAGLAALLRIDPSTNPTKQTIANLMRAHDANDQRIPGKTYRPSAQLGYSHLTFGAPKSVSVAWALSSPEEQSLIFAGWKQTVNSSMHRAAEIMGTVRRGNGGIHVEPGAVTWIQFHHRANWHGQMHMHTHVCVPAVTLSASGRVGTLYTRKLAPELRDIRRDHEKGLADNLHSHGIDVSFDPVRHEARITHRSIIKTTFLLY
jgi:TrwC relaxase